MHPSRRIHKIHNLVTHSDTPDISKVSVTKCHHMRSQNTKLKFKGQNQIGSNKKKSNRVECRTTEWSPGPIVEWSVVVSKSLDQVTQRTGGEVAGVCSRCVVSQPQELVGSPS
jgi:hypothetical protein